MNCKGLNFLGFVCFDGKFREENCLSYAFENGLKFSVLRPFGKLFLVLFVMN